LEEQEGVERLFFELSSGSRLSILRELQGEDLKTMEITRRLDLTGTEAFRQLRRLSDTNLVQRRPDGSYSITNYGRLVLHHSSAYELLYRHSDYFMAHDVWRLPTQFVNRIGELNKADLIMNPLENISRAERMLMEARQYGWGLAEGHIPAPMNQVMDEKIREGVEFRFLVPESAIDPASGGVPPNVEIRSLSEVPVVIVLTEEMADVCFCSMEGRVDYAGFSGADPVFHGWVRDLYLHYWGTGKRV